jgi:Flp pilus assembly protein TadD
LHILALQRHRQGRAVEAIAALRAAIATASQHAFLHSNLSHLLCEAGQFAAAIVAADAAIERNPNLFEAHLHRGNAMAASGHQAGAIVSFGRAIALRGDDARAHGNLANALQAAGKLEAALAAHRRAIQLDPLNAQMISNYATALDAGGELDVAVAVHQRALALRGEALGPRDARLLSNLGCTLHRLGRYVEAESAQRAALALRPDFPQAQVNLGLLRLLHGDYRAGWQGYEFRWDDRDRFPDARRQWERPRWNGSPLAGRTVLLHAEQGAGDTLQMVRYVPAVARLGGRVILECQPGLTRLLGGSPLGQSTTIERDGMRPAAAKFDVHLPLGSLPHVLGQPDPQASVRPPYLLADGAIRQRWRRRLGATRGRKIGLVWAGSPTHADDRRRSLPVAALDALADAPGEASFVSLQVGRLARGCRLAMIDFTAELTDWADTAALVAELDLVIGVDTGVVHLAGALGKAVWILLPAVPDSRWMLERDNSPWYPTARLFRQRIAGDWVDVMARVVEALGGDQRCGS